MNKKALGEGYDMIKPSITKQVNADMKRQSDIAAMRRTAGVSQFGRTYRVNGITVQEAENNVKQSIANDGNNTIKLVGIYYKNGVFNNADLEKLAYHMSKTKEFDYIESFRKGLSKKGFDVDLGDILKAFITSAKDYKSRIQTFLATLDEVVDSYTYEEIEDDLSEEVSRNKEEEEMQKRREEIKPKIEDDELLDELAAMDGVILSNAPEEYKESLRARLDEDPDLRVNLEEEIINGNGAPIIDSMNGHKVNNEPKVTISKSQALRLTNGGKTPLPDAYQYSYSLPDEDELIDRLIMNPEDL